MTLVGVRPAELMVESVHAESRVMFDLEGSCISVYIETLRPDLFVAFTVHVWTINTIEVAYFVPDSFPSKMPLGRAGSMKLQERPTTSLATSIRR